MWFDRRAPAVEGEGARVDDESVASVVNDSTRMLALLQSVLSVVAESLTGTIVGHVVLSTPHAM